jgi:PDZ domain-containing protein
VKTHLHRSWMVALLGALMALPMGLTAQEAPRAPRTPRPPREPRASTTWSYAFSNRARIGVVVATDADEAKDKIGARIEAVTPGGPADDAGLQAGDIITKFNGTALGGVASEDDEQSGPGNKLIELAHALEPGDTAKVEYRRGTQNKTAAIVAEDMGNRGYSFSMPRIPDFQMTMPEFPRGFGGENTFTIVGSPWGGLDMVTLNADLGEYFGTREGVLVVKTPEDSTLPVKGGDVILAIDGRKPTSPSSAMRILQSYEEGDTVKFDVMRHQRRSTVTWIVPDHEMRYRVTAPRPRRPRGQAGQQSMFRLEPGRILLPLKIRSVFAEAMKISRLRAI